MKFEIKKIHSGISKEERIYEYARRISFYHVIMTEERLLSKVFDCDNLMRNAIDNNGEEVGCLKRPDLDPCDSCKRSHSHYEQFRKYNRMRATALRQLNKTLAIENTGYEDICELYGKEYHPQFNAQ